ncbi:MAG: SurA N-terminal domain-containing protein [Candidatus Accumulibacter sp.]|jgi:peptidyl-prolyl cis-trans isomerase D|nr:SurA N-terminal domain-containing protein [Accumulibacter sp.]
MFDAIHSNKKIVKFLLQLFVVLITLPFVFWGVDSLSNSSGAETTIANVGDAKISIFEFDQALNTAQDRMRRDYGDAFRPEMINDPVIREGILNNLIEQRLLLLEADRRKLWLNDEVLRSVIAGAPQFQQGGRFSLPLYQAFLARSGLQFEASLREDLIIQQCLDMTRSAFVSNAQAEDLLRLHLEERAYHENRIPADHFFKSVVIGDDDAQKYYEENESLFEEPEQIKVEYLTLSQEDILATVKLSESEAKTWYDGHPDRYRQEEERHARHILIRAAKEGGEARAKAEKILTEVKKSPEKFVALAKQYSEDVGSAKSGGDLGFFQRDAMVKPFADAVFDTLKKNEISEIVESDFGYHIIQLIDIRPASVRAFAEVRAEIENELKQQAAARKFAETAESFSNMVYEQSDSLQPVAENFKLELKKTDWFSRKRENPAALGPLANDKLLNRLFSEDAIRMKQNTETIEISPGTLLTARVVEHTPASLKPLESVKKEIEERLRLRGALELAQKAGEERLDALKKGDEAKLAWSPVKTVARSRAPAGFTENATKAIFKVDSGSLPAYVGLTDGAGYTIFKVVKTTTPEKLESELVQGIRREYGTLVAQRDLSAFMDNLRKRYPVKIEKSKLSTQED